MGDRDTTFLKRTTEHERSELADLLAELAEQIRDGEVRFDGDDGPVQAAVPGRVHLSLEVKDSPKSEGLKHEVELEIWWIDQD